MWHLEAYLSSSEANTKIANLDIAAAFWQYGGRGKKMGTTSWVLNFFYSIFTVGLLICIRHGMPYSMVQLQYLEAYLIGGKVNLKIWKNAKIRGAILAVNGLKSANEMQLGTLQNLFMSTHAFSSSVIDRLMANPSHWGFLGKCHFFIFYHNYPWGTYTKIPTTFFAGFLAEQTSHSAKLNDQSNRKNTNKKYSRTCQVQPFFVSFCGCESLTVMWPFIKMFDHLLQAALHEALSRKTPLFNLLRGWFWRGAHTKFHPYRCNDKGIGTPKLKFLLRFDQNVEYKCPAWA